MLAFKTYDVGEFSLMEGGPDLLHQGLKRSRPFALQYPAAGEIRFVRVMRLGCGVSLGRAENTQPHESGKRAEQERLH